MLDFRIATFLKLCETKSYTKTAKSLHITQPSVTQHIKYLQKHFDCQLFNYEGKTLSLTPEGEYLRRQALIMTQNSTKIMEDLRRLTTKHSPLRFGCGKDFGESIVPKIVSRMMDEDEDLELSLCIENSAAVVKMLEYGQLDFILVDKMFAKPDFANYSVGKDIFCGWASPAHAKTLSGLTLKRMFREKLMLREDGSASRAVLEEVLDRRDCELEDFYASMISNTPSAVKELIAANAGITFAYTTAMADEERYDRIRSIFISDLMEEREIMFLYRKDNLDVERFRAFFDKFRDYWTKFVNKEI